jgi:beta-lactamase class A
MHRRDAVGALLCGVLAPLVLNRDSVAGDRTPAPDFGTIERQVAGRLGVAVLDTATGRRLAYRADERFAMCSTFKWLLGAQILARADAGAEQLSRVVPFAVKDLLEYAPVTRVHVREGGMTVSDLVSAAIRYSDNTAANLLLQTVGGPASFTAYLRQLGDRITRLDRVEPDLNSAIPGDARDTTTPNAMVANLRAVLLGDHLRPAARDQLIAWLVSNTTGAEKLRAGLPTTWRVGDKTGMGGHGATNDVAVTWPPKRQPVLLAAYLAETEARVADRNAALANVGHAVGRWVQAT